MITTKDLTYDAAAEEKINDRVTVVKLTGGTVTIDFDASKLPLSDKVKGAIPEFEKNVKSQSKTIDIAAEVAKNDGKPFRIATVKRGDTWYPSMFYTVADNAYQEAKAKDNPSLPSPADTGSITPIGGDSPEAAVNGLIDKALAGDMEGVIGMLPPDEMSVLYDYGRSLIEPAVKDDLKPVEGVTLSDVAWQVDDVTGGKKVSLKSISVTKDGQTVKIVRDPAANSLTITLPGQPTVVLSPDNLETYISKMGMRYQQARPAADRHHQARVRAGDRPRLHHRPGGRQVVRLAAAHLLGRPGVASARAWSPATSTTSSRWPTSELTDLPTGGEDTPRGVASPRRVLPSVVVRRPAPGVAGFTGQAYC